MKKRLLGVLSLVILGTTLSFITNAEEISANSIGEVTRSDIPHDGIDLGSGFSIDGYFRMGKQFKSDSGNPFTTGVWKTGRLANEGDSWNLDFNWRTVNTNGTWIKVMSTIERREIGNEPKDGIIDLSDVVMTNAFAKIGGFVSSSPDMAVWAGKRSVGKWHNSWLIDADLPSYNGTGLGIEDVDVFGGGKFEASYLYGKGYWWTNFPKASDEGYSHLLYLGYKPIKNLSFQIAASKYSQDETFDIKKQGFARTGVQATVAYDFDNFFGFLPGKSTVLLQYSKGSLEAKNAFASKKDSSIMGTVYGDTKIGKLPLSAQIFYKVANDYKDASVLSKDKTKVTEVGSTVRLFIPVVNNFMIQTEVGYGFTKWKGKETETQMKLAVAPTLVVGSIYNVTPQLRIIGAYQSIKNKDGSAKKEADINEFTIGAQVEISF